MTNTPHQGNLLPEWDLKDLYRGIDDPAVKDDLSEALGQARSFEETWRDRVNSSSLTPALLCEALVSLEKICETRDKLLSYAGLLFAGDTSEQRYGAFLQKVSEQSTAIRRHLIFFELEWIALPDEKADLLMAHPLLDRYRHYLQRERSFRPHRLPEGEEKIMEEKADTGRNAFIRLYDELLGGLRVSLPEEHGGEASLEEALSLLYDPDQKKRRAAVEGITGVLQENRRTLTYVFNVLVSDHAGDDRIRTYSHPMASRHLENEIDQETVNLLLDCCRRSYPLVDRYYNLKRRILGLATLFDYDRYAPLTGETETFSFSHAQEMVLGSFGRFSTQMADIAGMFFEQRWIDAALRPGKRGGAFSHSTVPSVHPYILVNYTGRQRDVMTLAHELGHGVHQYLSRGQGYFHCHTPLTTAEMASVFGEMLVFDAMKEAETDPRARLALLCGKIEDSIATVFRQVALTTFEETLHRARREEGELAAERIDQLWMESSREMFGDSVTITDNYACWWQYISHFIHAPFYCYAYAFGELLVFSLYSRYKEEGPSFVPRYMGLLEAGGNDSPEMLLQRVGVDIHDPGFWQGGVDILAEMVEEADALAV